MRIYIARLKERGQHHTKTDEELSALLRKTMDQKSDVWFSADEAKRWGFADTVFDGDHASLRVLKPNLARRKRMLAVLRRPVHVLTRTF